MNFEVRGIPQEVGGKEEVETFKVINRISELLEEQLNINTSVIESSNLSEREARSIRGLLTLIASPQSILAIPRLPYSYKPPGEERKRKPRYEPRKPNPQWHTIERPEQLDKWAEDSRFTSLEDVYSDVPLNIVLRILQPIPKLRKRIENARYQGKVSIRSILEKIRMSVTSQVYSEMIVEKGIKLIECHLPQFAPREEYVVIGEPGYLAEQGENGEYFGKINGRHIIFINTPADPYFDFMDIRRYEKEMPLLPVIGAHELMHQVHSERIKGGLGFQVKNGPPIEFIKRNTRDSILKQIEDVDTNNDIKGGVASSIDNAVIEGIATSAELYIALSERDRLRELGKNKEAERFDRAVRERIRILRRAKKTGEGEHYAVGTYKIVRKLSKEMNIEELGRFLGSVDLEAVRKIPKGSSQYDSIIEDPKTIPQLSNQ